MASNDFDDLLESFMNNSQKVYNDDKNAHKSSRDKLPSSYNVVSKNDKRTSSRNTTRTSSRAQTRKPSRPAPAKTRQASTSKRATSSAKKPNPPRKRKTYESPVKRFFGTLGKVVLALIMIGAVVSVVCFSVITIYGYSVVYGDPVFDLKDEASSQNQTSFIYGQEGKNLVEITRLHGEENRIWLDIDDMTEYLADAFVAIEDERFQIHHGVDWKRTIGVTVKMNGQGGSTITQQLIKNLTDENDVTFVRKFNEILSALNLEKNYSKDDIIEAYLNTIYLSHGCYGVKTAAETYFGKEVKDLNIAECACLAGITKAPTRYDPLLNPENNQDRQHSILKKMYDQGFITKDQYDEAMSYEMIYTNSKNYKGSKVKKKSGKKSKEKINSYYTDYVIEEVINDLQKMGYSAKKAKNLIYGGGLKIYSAVDFDVQAAIEDVYKNYRRMPDETVQGACVVMDGKGRILGIVGGTGKKKANRTLNRASQSTRQPGSTIKPLSVYGPALEKSLQDDDVDIYWSSMIDDHPLMKIDGKWWPTNDGGWYSGNATTLQKGLANSMNTISAQTLDKIGVDYSFDYISNKFHISTLNSVVDDDYAPMATGSLTNGVTVLEMTTAYQAFGNGGYYYEGYAYYKIEDSKGNILIEKDPEASREVALSKTTAGIMNKLLQTVMTMGTGTTYKLSGIQCYGKTGTTSEDKDRWFIGGTPEYVGGVWYGYDTPKEVHYNLSSNPSGTIWNLVMRNIYEKKGVKKREFKTPDGIVQREYSLANGKLCSGTGAWGWYDEDNMPGRTNISGVTKSSTTKKDDESTTKKQDSNSTTAARQTTTTTTTETTTEEDSTTSGDGPLE